jgi:hypothetical protein
VCGEIKIIKGISLCNRKDKMRDNLIAISILGICIVSAIALIHIEKKT